VGWDLNFRSPVYERVLTARFTFGLHPASSPVRTGAFRPKFHLFILLKLMCLARGKTSRLSHTEQRQNELRYINITLGFIGNR
jgi:hypothetical protein